MSRERPLIAAVGAERRLNELRRRFLPLICLGAGLLAACGRQEAAVNAPLPGEMTPAAPALERLRGGWVRPDGGYVLEIRGVAVDGKLDAGYFNPRPIRVAQAAAATADATVTVIVELRDVGYPGSRYTLAYEPAADQLTGTYYQAVAKETYRVVFQRRSR